MTGEALRGPSAAAESPARSTLFPRRRRRAAGGEGRGRRRGAGCLGEPLGAEEARAPTWRARPRGFIRPMGRRPSARRSRGPAWKFKIGPAGNRRAGGRAGLGVAAAKAEDGGKERCDHFCSPPRRALPAPRGVPRSERVAGRSSEVSGAGRHRCPHPAVQGNSNVNVSIQPHAADLEGSGSPPSAEILSRARGKG